MELLVAGHKFFDIELSSVCNMHCNICPRSKISRYKSRLTMQDVVMLNHWLPQKCNIMFSGMGEPLLFENILEAVSLLSNGSRVIGITTNGQLLDEHMILELCNSQLDFLQVSVNHIDEDKYREITNGNNKCVLKYIEYLNLVKPDSLQVQLSFIDDYLSEKDKRIITDYCVHNKINTFFKKLHNRGGSLLLNVSKNKLGINADKFECYLFSQFTFISCDGNILPCCHDIKQRNILGNIYDDSFEEIVNRKRDVIKCGELFDECRLCNDVGRYNILNYEK